MERSIRRYNRKESWSVAISLDTTIWYVINLVTVLMGIQFAFQILHDYQPSWLTSAQQHFLSPLFFCKLPKYVCFKDVYGHPSHVPQLWAAHNHNKNQNRVKPEPGATINIPQYIIKYNPQASTSLCFMGRGILDPSRESMDCYRKDILPRL